MTKKSNGFTFIEILITLAVIAVTFLPLMRMYSVCLEQAGFADDLMTAKFLAEEGMERVKNLNFTKSQLKREGNSWQPPLTDPAAPVNGKRWRTLRTVVPSSDPLEIRVQVFRAHGSALTPGEMEPVVELVTLFEDLEWSLPEE